MPKIKEPAGHSGQTPGDAYQYYTTRSPSGTGKTRRGKPRLTQERLERIEAAKGELIYQVGQYQKTPEEAANDYLEAFPDIPPAPLFMSNYERNYQSWRAFNRGNKLAARIFGTLSDPHFYSLKHKHLGLPQELSGTRLLYADEGEIIKTWFDRAKELLEGPLYLKIEGGEREINLHVLADGDAGLTHIKRGGKVIQSVYDPVGMFEYFVKPALANTPENLVTWIEARRKYPIRLPNTRIKRDIPGPEIWRLKD